MRQPGSVVVHWELKEKKEKGGGGPAFTVASDTARERQLRLTTELAFKQVQLDVWSVAILSIHIANMYNNGSSTTFRLQRSSTCIALHA